MSQLENKKVVVSSDERKQVSQKALRGEQIPPLVLFLVSKITAEALWFLKVQQAILTFGPFGALIILRNLFNFFLIFAEIRFWQKS